MCVRLCNMVVGQTSRVRKNFVTILVFKEVDAGMMRKLTLV